MPVRPGTHTGPSRRVRILWDRRPAPKPNAILRTTSSEPSNPARCWLPSPPAADALFRPLACAAPLRQATRTLQDGVPDAHVPAEGADETWLRRHPGFTAGLCHPLFAPQPDVSNPHRLVHQVVELQRLAPRHPERHQAAVARLAEPLLHRRPAARAAPGSVGTSTGVCAGDSAYVPLNSSRNRPAFASPPALASRTTAAWTRSPRQSASRMATPTAAAQAGVVDNIVVRVAAPHQPTPVPAGRRRRLPPSRRRQRQNCHQRRAGPNVGEETCGMSSPTSAARGLSTKSGRMRSSPKALTSAW